MQRVKIRHAGWVRRDNFGSDDGGFGREKCERVSDDVEPRGEICAIARMNADFCSFLVQLHAVAIELDLVQPTVALGGRSRSAGWAGLMKAEGQRTATI